MFGGQGVLQPTGGRIAYNVGEGVLEMLTFRTLNTWLGILGLKWQRMYYLDFIDKESEVQRS